MKKRSCSVLLYSIPYCLGLVASGSVSKVCCVHSFVLSWLFIVKSAICRGCLRLLCAMLWLALAWMWWVVIRCALVCFWNVRGLSLHNSKTYLCYLTEECGISIKIDINQWNKIESRNWPTFYGQFSFWQGAKAVQWGNNNTCINYWIVKCEKWKSILVFYHIITWQCIINLILNVKL